MSCDWVSVIFSVMFREWWVFLLWSPWLCGDGLSMSDRDVRVVLRGYIELLCRHGLGQEADE